MTTTPISPRSGRNMTPAVNIPQMKRAAHIPVPSPPQFSPSSPTSSMLSRPPHRYHHDDDTPSPHENDAQFHHHKQQHHRHHQQHVHDYSDFQPHPPSSPHPPVDLEMHGHVGGLHGHAHHDPHQPGSLERSPRRRQRRHTVSSSHPSSLLAPLQLHRSHPPDLFTCQEAPEQIAEEVHDDGEEAKEQLAAELQRRPLPSSSSAFQRAMMDLKFGPTYGDASPSSEEDEEAKEELQANNHSLTKCNDDVDQNNPTPSIEVTEPRSGGYSLDIALNTGEEDTTTKELSKSAPSDSGFHAIKKAAAEGRIGSADFANRYDITPGSSPMASPKSARKERPRTGGGRQRSPRENQHLNVPLLGQASRKWRSTDGSLPALHLPHHLSDDGHDHHERSVHSPFISSPFSRRKMSLPTGALHPRRHAMLSPELRSLSEESEGRRSRRDSQDSLKYSVDSGSETSPPSSAHSRTKSRSPHGYNEIISPLNLKTAAKITRLIEAAAASSCTPGGNKNQHLLPGEVSLPPVCSTTGRLLVHRRRDDSMRLAKQAVNLENDIAIDQATSHHHDRTRRESIVGTKGRKGDDVKGRRHSLKAKHGHKSLLGFSEV